MEITVKQAAEEFGLKCLTPGVSEDSVIKDVYIGDLLSWVMGKAPEGCAWITIQSHINIIAVAVLVEASCIIVAEKAEVPEDTLKKAAEENLPVFSTELTSYQLAALFAKHGA